MFPHGKALWYPVSYVINSTALLSISYPDLPRPREREISLSSIRQSEIWVQDYIVAMEPGGAFKAKKGNVEEFDWISLHFIVTSVEGPLTIDG